jgi:hypothetical protein
MDGDYQLVIQMWDAAGRYADVTYDMFKLSDQTYYALEISGFVEPNPYGLKDELISSHNSKFSTKDTDNSVKCATRTSAYKNAAWW